MANFLVRIQFVNTHELSDWHETWYTEAGTSELALTQALEYTEVRRKSLSDQVEIRRASVSNVLDFRDIKLRTGRWGVIQGDSQKQASKAADFPDTGWLCQLVATDFVSRHICFRGLPDALLGGPDGGSARGIFDSIFRDLVTVITGKAKFQIRHKAIAPAPVQIASIDPSEATVQFTTAAAHGLAVGDRATVRKVKGPAVNGTYRVHQVGNATTFTISKRGVETRDILNLGTVQKLGWSYASIANGEPLRVSARKSRIPFVGRRGRSTKRR